MITVNMTKAKAIAHDARRAARAEEFKPHDEVIMKLLEINFKSITTQNLEKFTLGS